MCGISNGSKKTFFNDIFFYFVKITLHAETRRSIHNFRILRMNIRQVSFPKTLVNCQNTLLYKTRKVFEPAFYLNLFISNIFCLISGGKIFMR